MIELDMDQLIADAPHKTLQQMAEKHYCSISTVKSRLMQSGEYYPKKRHRKPHEKAMIQNDWNGDMSLDRICRVYEIPSRQHLLILVNQWRQKGMHFKRHEPNKRMADYTKGGADSARTGYSKPDKGSPE